MDNNDSINQQQSPTTIDSIINQTKAPNCIREPNKILNSWLHLQKIIKEEITLGDTSNILLLISTYLYSKKASSHLPTRALQLLLQLLRI